MNANDYKAIEKVPSIKQTQQETQTDSEHTQVMLSVESEFIENAAECLDAINPLKYIISKFNETSEIEDSDTDDEVMSLWTK